MPEKMIKNPKVDLVSDLTICWTIIMLRPTRCWILSSVSVVSWCSDHCDVNHIRSSLIDFFSALEHSLIYPYMESMRIHHTPLTHTHPNYLIFFMHYTNIYISNITIYKPHLLI